MPLLNNNSSANKVSGAFGHVYTTVTGANGDHAQALHGTVLADVFDDLDAAGFSFQDGIENSLKKHIFTMHLPESHI